MKKNIALVTGGFSGEAVISYRTAATIASNLDPDAYNVYKIDITSEGWFYETESDQRTVVDKNDFSLITDGKKVLFDAVFIAMHGTPGEDGKLQGYFDTLKIPYTSCDAASSAITFNKRYAVAVAKMAGIAVAKSLHLFSHSPIAAAEVANSLQFPVFVKPNNGGSSIGMSKVDDASVLQAAIDKAFVEDDQVLVEEMVKGREFTVGVFKSQGAITVLPITEVRAHADKDFFDFEAKYQGKSDEITPADISDEMAGRIRNAATKIYEVFNLRGVVRIDFIYNEEKNEPFMLEINTIPGQSSASVVPQQVRALGWSLRDFYTKLVEETLES